MSMGNRINHPLGPRKRFCKRGHDTFACGRIDSHCRDCEKDRQKIIREKNIEEIAEWHRIWYQDNIEEIRKKHLEYYRTHTKEAKEYKQKHPAAQRLHSLKRNSKRRLRVVLWGQEGILDFYANCPIGMVVDHIIPLCGRKVSGLHVLSNLQYLTVKENAIKHNCFDGTLENNGWRLR